MNSSKFPKVAWCDGIGNKILFEICKKLTKKTKRSSKDKFIKGCLRPKWILFAQNVSFLPLTKNSKLLNYS